MILLIFSPVIVLAGVPPATNPTLYIYPAVTDVQPGATFTVEVKLREITAVLGVDVILNYNKDVLRATWVTEGVIKDLIVGTDYTPAPGTITFAASNTTPSSFGIEGGVILTITFEALATGSTDITFAASELTVLGGGGEPEFVAHDAAQGTVNVSFAVITGQVILPGRDDHSGVQVTVKLAGGGYISTTTNAAGHFTLGVPAGLYRLRFNKAGFLVSVRETLVNVQHSANYQLLPETLDPGDASGDNIVNLLDLSLLALAFDTITGDSNYDIRVDFNADGAINLADLTLLAGSYHKVGDAW